MVNGVDLSDSLASMTSSPVGWLSAELLLVVAYPDGCQGHADLWSFSAGFCPGAEYGAHLIIEGTDLGGGPRDVAPAASPTGFHRADRSCPGMMSRQRPVGRHALLPGAKALVPLSGPT